MRKLYIADWHYGHKNVIAYDSRPFFTLDEMNSELIKRWNSAVSPEDTVYILGDMFWCDTNTAVDVLKQLNGKKVLIKGNHDKCEDENFQKQFTLICDYLEINDQGKNIVLCHYPIPCFKNHYYGWYHFYGHVHSSFDYNMMLTDQKLMKEVYNKECNMWNVGAMMPCIEYTPRLLTKITKC